MNRIFIIMSCLFIHNITLAQTPANDLNWQLRWQDNFDSFNTNRWIKADYCDHGGKPFLFRVNNVWIENGQLVLRVKSEMSSCPNSPPNPTTYCCGSCEPNKQYNYTSGWVETKSNDFDTHYGYIEAKIKFPFRKGVKHAFWTWRGAENPNYQYKNAAEIDIFESTAKHDATKFETNIHTYYTGGEPQRAQVYSFSNSSYTDWHTYAIEWTKDRIIWYVDGKSIRNIDNSNFDLDGNGIIDPVRLIFSITVENGYLQYLPPSFEEYIYVDYVKVYGLKYDCRRTVVEIPSFSNYNYAVKKSISLSGATSIPSNSNICLRATDFIELKDGFEVPLGTEMYFDISPCEDNSIGINDPLPPEY